MLKKFLNTYQNYNDMHFSVRPTHLVGCYVFNTRVIVNQSPNPQFTWQKLQRPNIQ